MDVSIIVAVSINGVIGKGNKLLWSLPDEMAHFKKITDGHTVIMGRKTWESIPEKYRPLSNRENIVLSRDPEYAADEAVTCDGLISALNFCANNGDKVFIIGGEQIYKEALTSNLVNKMYVTQVNKSFEGDAHFSFNPNDWANCGRTFHPIDEKHDTSFYFDKYVRVGN